MDRWDGGNDYDKFMGRWSRVVAAGFLKGLTTPPGMTWLDVGCGTGALSEAIVAAMNPLSVFAVDSSPDFVEYARTQLRERAAIEVASAARLPFPDKTFDVLVSGLLLNFVADPAAAIAEWARVTRTGGKIAAYVWDYADGMEFLRRFWDAATNLDAAAVDVDEGVRFPICQPGPLVALFTQSGLTEVASGSVQIETIFTGFDDYWAPFLTGQGPAPTYVSTLDEHSRSRLENALRTSLPAGPNGEIELTARAWTVVATV
ncbi:MAG: class I SAM-dependent methyltransferase [Acidimicrobiia bacterium]